MPQCGPSGVEPTESRCLTSGTGTLSRRLSATKDKFQIGLARKGLSHLLQGLSRLPPAQKANILASHKTLDCRMSNRHAGRPATEGRAPKPTNCRECASAGGRIATCTAVGMQQRTDYRPHTAEARAPSDSTSKSCHRRRNPANPRLKTMHTNRRGGESNLLNSPKPELAQLIVNRGRACILHSSSNGSGSVQHRVGAWGDRGVCGSGVAGVGTTQATEDHG